MQRSWLLASLLLALLVVAPSPASAITTEEVVAALAAGKPPAEVVALIKVSESPFAIEGLLGTALPAEVVQAMVQRNTDLVTRRSTEVALPVPAAVAPKMEEGTAAAKPPEPGRPDLSPEQSGGSPQTVGSIANTNTDENITSKATSTDKVPENAPRMIEVVPKKKFLDFVIKGRPKGVKVSEFKRDKCYLFFSESYTDKIPRIDIEIFEAGFDGSLKRELFAAAQYQIRIVPSQESSDDLRVAANLYLTAQATFGRKLSQYFQENNDNSLFAMQKLGRMSLACGFSDMLPWGH